MRKRETGFTLLEVLVALAIAAVGLGAVTKALYQNIDVADRLGQKMIGTWVAGNYLTEQQIAREFLSAGSNRDSVNMAGREWQIEATYTPTGDNEIVRIDVTVYEGGGLVEQPAASLFGFISQPSN